MSSDNYYWSKIKFPTTESGSFAIVAESKAVLDMVRSIYSYTEYSNQVIFLPETELHPYEQIQKGQTYVDMRNLIILTLSPFIVTPFKYQNVYSVVFSASESKIMIKSFAEHPQAGAWEGKRNVGEFWAQVRENWVWSR